MSLLSSRDDILIYTNAFAEAKSFHARMLSVQILMARPVLFLLSIHDVGTRKEPHHSLLAAGPVIPDNSKDCASTAYTGWPRTKMNRPIIFFFVAVLVGASLATMLWAPEGTRLLYSAYVVSIPLALATIFLRPFWGVLIILLVGGIWGPKVSLGIFNMYLYHWIILLTTLGLVLQGIVFRVEHQHHRAGLPNTRGMPLLAVGPMLSALISLPLASQYGYTIAIKHILFAGVLFCAYYIAINVMESWERVRIFLKVLLAGTSLTAIAALISGRFAAGDIGTSVLSNTNALGDYLVVPVILWIALLTYRVHLFRSWLVEASALSITLLAIMLSLSRSAWLGFGVGLAFVLLVARRIRLAIILSLMILVMLAALLATNLDAMERKMGSEGQWGIHYRIMKINLAMSMFAESPVVGNGPGSFEMKALESEERAIREHSTLECTYPYILAEYGIVGAIAWGWAFWLCVKLWLRLPKSRQDPARIIGNAIAAAIVCVLAIQVGENTVFFPKTNWIIGFLVGTCAALHYLPSTAGESWSRPPEPEASLLGHDHL